MSNPFDPNAMGPLGGLLGGLQQKIDEMKRRAAETEVEGVAGGGLVKVVMSCDFQVSAVHVDPSAMDDREMLEDLLRAATNEATRKAREAMANAMQDLAGGLPIPPGLLGM